jgi:hypothetical protein
VAHPCASPRSALGFVPASSTRAWANRQRGRGLFFEAGWSRWSACVSRVGCAVSAAALVLPHRPTYDVRQSQKNTCLQDLKPGNSKVPERCALEILRTQSICRHRDSLTTNGFAINLQPVKDHRKHREAYDATQRSFSLERRILPAVVHLRLSHFRAPSVSGFS